jgi:hypothetical protein
MTTKETTTATTTAKDVKAEIKRKAQQDADYLHRASTTGAKAAGKAFASLLFARGEHGRIWALEAAQHAVSELVRLGYFDGMSDDVKADIRKAVEKAAQATFSS